MGIPGTRKQVSGGACSGEMSYIDHLLKLENTTVLSRGW